MLKSAISGNKNRDSSHGRNKSQERLRISEAEQRRLVQESRLLTTYETLGETDHAPLSFSDELFRAITLIIPFTSLFLMMDILVHHQYGQTPTFTRELGRLIEVLPFLSLFLFYTNKHKNERLLQSALFALSIACGTRMIYLVNQASYLKVMRQAPPLGTLWVCAIWLLELSPAVLSLILTYVWVTYTGLKIVL